MTACLLTLLQECVMSFTTYGSPLGRAVKSAVSLSLDHLTSVSGVGSGPALATCETSQVLLAGVPGGFLAHLSRRLTGELIVYPCSGVRPSSSVRPSVVRRPQFQRSSPLKPLGQSKPNFMWSILRKGERKFI